MKNLFVVLVLIISSSTFARPKHPLLNSAPSEEESSEEQDLSLIDDVEPDQLKFLEKRAETEETVFNETPQSSLQEVMSLEKDIVLDESLFNQSKIIEDEFVVTENSEDSEESYSQLPDPDEVDSSPSEPLPPQVTSDF